MSKHRKHREAPGGMSPPGPPSGSGGHPASGVFARGVLLQLLALVGLSCVLGFTFNAASPVGVRFSEAVAAAVPAKVPTETTPIPTILTRTNPIVTPPLPPTPVEVATTTPRPIPPAIKPAVGPTLWSVSKPQAITNPVVFAAAPPTVPPNPAPIHWLEAKTLGAASEAVLVDVRHKAMFDAGHIPGAISLPEMSPPEEFKTFLSQQPTNMMVIVYCSSTSCSQSARVASRLVNEFHWPSVRYMTGGYAEYQQAELAKPAPSP